MTAADAIDFIDPVPESTYARVALTGPGGAGKTWTSLLLARGLIGDNGLIGLVDTDHKTATKYRKWHQFKVCDLDYYDPASLINAIGKAVERNVDCLIIDSFSHFWSGHGGILAQVDQRAGSYSGNNFSGWKDVRPLEAEMMTALLGFPGHVIVTMRVKTDWVLEPQANGKTKPVKHGLKPEQREGIDYEWDLVGGLDTSHVLTITKTRLHEIDMDEAVVKPDIEFGARIAAALREGSTPPAVNTAAIGAYRARVLTPGITRPELEVIRLEADRVHALGVIITSESGQGISLLDLIRQQWRTAPADRPAVPAEGDGQWAEEFTGRVTACADPMNAESLRDDLMVAVENGTCPPGLGDPLNRLIDSRLTEIEPVAAGAGQ